MTRIYRYILTNDHGMAPCPADGRITLATCKPVIRRMAKVGDWVLGFRPGSLERGLLLWAGRVERVLNHGSYEREYRGRADAIYRQRGSGGYQRLRPDYHPSLGEMNRDTANPVLVFDPAVSRYLDGQPEALPQELAHLAAAGRGHRVNGTQEGDVERLEAWLATLVIAHPPSGAQSIRDYGPTKTSCQPRPRTNVRRGC